jgi:hypothetical protein
MQVIKNKNIKRTICELLSAASFKNHPYSLNTFEFCISKGLGYNSSLHAVCTN